MTTKRQHKQVTAEFIGVPAIGISTLGSLYYHNRRAESLTGTCAFLLCAYRDTDSDYMRNTYRRLMENVYFTL